VTEQSTAPLPLRRPPEQRETRIVSARQSVGHRLVTLWANRDLVVHLARTDIKVKYKNSALGLLWSLVSPLMQLAIFYFVFQVVLANGIHNFVIFLFAGLMVWNFFQGSVVTSTGIIVERAGIVKKVSFPREILPLSAVGAQVVYFAMQLVPMVIFLAVLGVHPDWPLLWLLVLAMAALLVVASALGVLLSALNVKLRDMRHLVEIAMMAWFWLTPIVYSFEATLSKSLHRFHLTWLYLANPMTPIVLTFQRVFYPHLVITNTKTAKIEALQPTWSVGTYALLDGIVLVVGAIAFVVAVGVFGRLEGNFAEEL
jgi:ABC-2 type transport system permease protein